MAYEPLYVYTAIAVLLIASSFGFPVPEEVTLLSAGLLSHIGMHPELYPPPSPDAVGVHVAIAATVCFFAVLCSDLLVFALGRHFGPQILKNRFVSRIMTPKVVDRINNWSNRFGPYACGIFRFTPGLRFPGHFACGTFGISYTKFIAIDGTAALLTVPTQVVLMAFFGQEILGAIKTFKIAIGVGICVVVAIYIWRKWRAAQQRRLESRLGKPTGPRTNGDNHSAA